MTENQFDGVVDSLFRGMDTILSTKTVVGEPTQIGDTTIIPLVDVAFGLGAGSGNNHQKGDKVSNGGGLGGKMTPCAVLVIRNGSAKIINIHEKKDALAQILDIIPDVMDKFTKNKKDKEELSEEEVVDIAFPEEEDIK